MKMKLKIITMTMIIALLLVSGVPKIYGQEAEPVQEETVDPAIMNMIKTQAMQRKQEMMNLFGEGPFSPEVENSLQQAEQAMEMAQSFEDNDPQAAAQQYLRAMKQYRNALRKHLQDNPEAAEEFEEPSATDSAEDEITETFSEEEIEAAKNMLLNRFQERYREQIQSMIELVDELEGDLSPNDATKARNALMHTLEKTLRIQERINQGETDEAVDDLDAASQELDDEFDGLEEEDSAQMLKAMNRLEARIRKMMQNRSRKAALGEDTLEEDAAIEELSGKKNQIKNGYIENKRNGPGTQGGNGTGQGSQSGNGQGTN
jgi:hypothetical protein